MPRRPSPKTALTHIFDESSSPVYVLDDQGQIIYCNRALAEWTGIAANTLIGRQVAYHSADEPSSPPGVAAGLCPPPNALAGQACEGHVSCQTGQGQLVYRRGHFEPLVDTDTVPEPAGVLAVLSACNLPLDEITASLAPSAKNELLHATVRRFRHHQASHYDLATLVGVSPAMQRIRWQIEMAASTNGPVTILGPPGSGRERIAKAIHYAPPYTAEQQFIVQDGPTLAPEELQWSIESLRSGSRTNEIDTLLIRDIDLAELPVQQQLFHMLSAGYCGRSVDTRPIGEHPAPMKPLSAGQGGARVVVTASGDLRDRAANDAFDAKLAAVLAVLVIEAPPLGERREDLPLLAQFFVEECNRGREQQIGGLSREAVEMLALYAWPRGLDELREVLSAAHLQATETQITTADLPAILHHAAAAAALSDRECEPIDLDDFLARIEHELIERALRQAEGNKTRAAELLGMNRPRLYRRLAQLGLD